MLIITVYDDQGQQKFLVHDAQARDVTDQFEVRALVVQDEQGHIGGYHIGRRLAPEDVLELNAQPATTNDEDGS